MNILMFCSNPVNGGTARIFYELVTLFKTLLSEEDKLYACVNEENPVEIYKKIDGLCRLPIYSAQELYANLYGGNIFKRLVNSTVRKAKYKKAQENNINVMEQFIIDNNIDSVIIHNGGYVGDDLCNQMLTAAHRSKCVSHNVLVLHNDMEKNLLTKLRYMSYDKRISREATEIVTVSNYTRDRMVESSFIEKEIEVIYNGLTINKVMTQEEKAKHIIVNDKLRNILMIGNFAQNKGQREFIEAAAELLKDKNLEIHFTLIGNVYDATYFEQCMAYIRNKKIEEAFSIYHGVHNAYEYIDMFDMLVVPSLYDESFGLISLEAMANGRPVVAFACGGIPEVVQDGRDGLVVPVGDSHKMAEAIKWLVNNPKESLKMGENGLLDYEEKFSAEAMAKQYLNIIRK